MSKILTVRIPADSKYSLLVSVRETVQAYAKIEGGDEKEAPRKAEVIRGLTKLTDVTKLIGVFYDYENAPNNIRTKEKIRKDKSKATQNEAYDFYPSVEVLNQWSLFYMQLEWEKQASHNEV